MSCHISCLDNTTLTCPPACLHARPPYRRHLSLFSAPARLHAPLPSRHSVGRLSSEGFVQLHAAQPPTITVLSRSSRCGVKCRQVPARMCACVGVRSRGSCVFTRQCAPTSVNPTCALLHWCVSGGGVHARVRDDAGAWQWCTCDVIHRSHATCQVTYRVWHNQSRWTTTGHHCVPFCYFFPR